MAASWASRTFHIGSGDKHHLARLRSNLNDGQRLRELVGGGQYAYRGRLVSQWHECRRLVRWTLRCIRLEKRQVGMTGAHFIALLEPVDRAVQLVEMQKLVETADTSFRHLAGIIDVEPIDGRIEALPVNPSKYWTPRSSSACSNRVSWFKVKRWVRPRLLSRATSFERNPNWGAIPFAEVADVVSGSDSAHSEKMAIRRRRTNQAKSALFEAGVSRQVTAENGAPADSATTKALATKDSHASKPIGAPRKSANATAF